MDTIAIWTLQTPNVSEVWHYASRYEAIPFAWDEKYELKVQRVEETYSEILSTQIPENLYLLAQSDLHEIVGICWMTLITKWGEKAAHLHALWVQQDFRKQGIGHRLLQTADSWARDCGALFSHLYVEEKNSSGFLFYSKDGYRPKKIEMIKEYDSTVGN